MIKLLELWANLFVVWVVLFSAAAYFVPDAFLPLRQFIVPGLGIIMFGMGMTLTLEDFARVAGMKRAVGCGLLGQFLIMPCVAWVLAMMLPINNELAMGLIIVGACPGGTASNVIAYLAKADVALSVTMTACSTLIAIVATPLLIWGLGGEYLPVDAFAMLKSVVTIVLIPVVAGLGVRHFLQARAERVLVAFPAISVLVIVLIIAAIVAASKDRLGEVIGVIGIAVILHNLAGMTFGYGLGKLFRLPPKACRAVAIEVGMQNSGLGVALATSHFANSPLVALPASLFSVIHNLTGSAAAQWCRRDDSSRHPERSEGSR